MLDERAMTKSDTSGFYDTLPRLTSFADLTDPSSYAPLPDDWHLGCADIVASTRAIAEGRYKTVNMVGAAVISAQINRARGRAFPFVFGGDGAAFACAPGDAEAAALALGAVQRWAGDEFGLTLRTAMARVDEIRAAGLDVRVARHLASEELDYAMFAGGGLSWLEARMKAGERSLPPAPEGVTPDLTGLSCRWSNMPSVHGRIVSLVVEPAGGVAGPDFAAVAEDVIALAERLDRSGHPVPPGGPGTAWPPKDLTLDAAVSRGTTSLASRRRKVLAETLFAWLIFKTGLRVGGFDPRVYRDATRRNADYRKFDDGLKMTLDCDAETADRIRDVLESARAKGILSFGMFAQDEAMMTCIVPSALSADHVHFVDGASGGYAEAAARIRPA